MPAYTRETLLQLPHDLSYEDVLLRPGHSDIGSRDLCNPATRLGPIELGIPVISANMERVTEKAMMIAMGQMDVSNKMLTIRHGLGIHHHFYRDDEFHLHVEEIQAVKAAGCQWIASSIGVGDGCLEKIDRLVAAGVNVLSVEMSSGHHTKVGRVLEYCEAKYADLVLIAGNVATPEGALFLINHGADIIKVGFGSGAPCTSRRVAAVGVPQITAILECATVVKEHHKSLIADGGIKLDSGRISLAIACNADAVMIGNAAGATDEAPGEVIEHDGKRYMWYAGSYSAYHMHHYKGKNGSRVPEGEAMLVPVKGPIKNVISNLVASLQQSMAYVGAYDLAQFRQKATFSVTSPNEQMERRAHGLDEPGVISFAQAIELGIIESTI